MTNESHWAEGAVSEHHGIDETVDSGPEVARLRRRVAQLEAALAASQATVARLSRSERTPNLSPSDKLDHIDRMDRAESMSEFSAPATPAVVSVYPVATSSLPTSGTPKTVAEVAADPGFAKAWQDEGEGSFTEQLAQRAFFRAFAADEKSRNWLLDG